jgi:hypothetical protein
MPDAILSTLLAKAKVFGGPIAACLLIGVSAGWFARGERATANTLAATVARLDSNTVKRPEFERTLLRLEAVAVRQDSTNALLKRFICRSAPTICP